MSELKNNVVNTQDNAVDTQNDAVNTQDKAAKLNKYITVTLHTGSWAIVCTDNNLLNATVRVSVENGPSWVLFRIKDKSNKVVADTSSGVYQGQTCEPMRVPSNSGTYTLEAKAGITGTYTLHAWD